MKRILVTGGAGFLGSHLCEKLLHQGHEVLCLDNFYTGRKENITGLEVRFPSKFEVIRHDITSPIYLEIDQIYNLACPASPVHYQKDPIKTLKTNILGVLNMLELAKENEATILQASTSEVYGDPKEHPQGEEYWGNVNPIGMRSCYDEGKRVAESLIMEYFRKYRNRVNIRIARIFNTYGPGMSINDGRAISNFITQALTGRDITVYGGGAQTRSFCYVTDMIKGLITLMNTHGCSYPVNLGNPVEITIAELAKLIAWMTSSSSRLVGTSIPEDDPKRRQPDISMAKRLLNWEPEVNLRDGLVETISYFRKELSNV